MRKTGIFYTPRPVVSFIVRSVDEVLHKDFGLEYGLADTTTWGEMAKRNRHIKIPNGVSEHDPFVQILDPAVGTGTFLVEVIDLIYKTMTKKWESQGHMPLEFDKLWNEYVPLHLLPRLYGFELMMAPYAIAHMKIGLKLFETGYRFDSDERARIYLTNSLEPPKDFPEYLAEVARPLAIEAQDTNKIKREAAISVIIGNPPYANFGKMNKNEWIAGLINDYKKGLNERKINIDDDYIKFIRFAQWKLGDGEKPAILGFISNNSYLDGLTHRRMRQCLLNSFSELYVADLHGNLSAQETDKLGNRDENVFDIKQGVAIALMSNGATRKPSSKVHHSDILGTREAKYNLLSTEHAIIWTDVSSKVKQPSFFLVPKETGLANEYKKGLSLKEFGSTLAYGIQTKQDALFVDFAKDDLEKRTAKILRDVKELGSEKTADRHNLGTSSGWSAERLEGVDFNRDKIRRVLYRPFDIRWIYYDQKALGRARYETLKHMLKPNIGIVTMRQVFQQIDNYNHAIVTTFLIDERTFYSNRGGTYLIPLYRYLDPAEVEETKGNWFENGKWPIDEHGRMSNIASNVAKDIAGKLGLNLFHSREQKQRLDSFLKSILDYIYAIFYSPIYRKRYLDFLKIDFPRIPITSNGLLFKELCTLGRQLVGLHLMESERLNNHITTFPVSGDNAVTKVGEKRKALAEVKNGKGRLFINKTQYFAGVPEDVWNFQIGGYQVCHKWLADRKKAGRKLSADDIEHYHKIVVAINKTIKIMKQIDETIDAHGGWPIK